LGSRKPKPLRNLSLDPSAERRKQEVIQEANRCWRSAEYLERQAWEQDSWELRREFWNRLIEYEKWVFALHRCYGMDLSLMLKRIKDEIETYRHRDGEEAFHKLAVLVCQEAIIEEVMHG